MEQELQQIFREACAELEHVEDSRQLEEIRVQYLGKKGKLTAILRGMGRISPEDRPRVGQIANRVREQLEQMLEECSRRIDANELQATLEQETLDVTLPGRPIRRGHLHPLTLIGLELEQIFTSLGFAVVEGPEIESDYYNFEALNLPKEHPARDMQDSFYITGDILLRTHTSPVQIRYMLSRAPELPVRMVCPGRVYRRDDDATHSPMFHQIEGLLVDENVSFAQLKGTLLTFARQMFGADAEIRLRPSFFPFTEPSVEVDVSCTLCKGRGRMGEAVCRTCKGSGWLEILGAGMVHPQVLRNGGYDPEKVTGFAFGMGLERIAMLKYGIDDMRLFFQNDIRFLEQFQ